MEKEHVLFRDRPEWADVVPIPQDDGPNPVVVINYAPAFADAMDMFRAVAQRGERTPRVLELTAFIIAANPSHYSIWQLRQATLDALQPDLAPELDWVSELQEDHPKSYQSWHHRMWVVERLHRAGRLDSDAEWTTLGDAIVSDAKNYHAWSYRQWLVRLLGAWESELEFVTECIRVDVRNNSAWNQRMFCVRRADSAKLAKDAVAAEVQFALAKIALAPSNESPWSFLRGLLEHVFGSLAGTPFTEPLLELCREYVRGHTRSVHVYAFLVAILEAELSRGESAHAAKIRTECVDLCRQLESSVDPIRANYWAFRAAGVSG